MQQHSRGPPSLQAIAKGAVLRFKSFLHDLGYVPVELIYDGLAACTPAELADVEDATLAGSERDISALTWPLWWRHCTNGALGAILSLPKKLPPLVEAAEAAATPPPQPGVAPADYRLVYRQLQQQLEERRQSMGKRLKEMRNEQEQRRKERTVLVIEPLDRRRGRAKQAAQRGGPPRLPNAKERLIKKLNMAAPRMKPPLKPVMRPPVRRPLPPRSALDPNKPQQPVAAKKKVLPPAKLQLVEDDIFG